MYKFYYTYYLALYTDSISTIDAEDYTLRLVGGSREGVLEVALNGIWGTVCSDPQWDASNAEVACKELGLATEDNYSITPQPRYLYQFFMLACTHVPPHNNHYF